MPEFAFDVKLWAVCRVQAASEAEARAKMVDYLDEMVLNHDHDGVAIGTLCL